MAVLRAVPSRVWSAVAALVVLASLGVAIVLGAGLQVWRGTVGDAPRLSGAPLPGRGSGVITLPPAAPEANPPATGPSAPSGPVGPAVAVPGDGAGSTPPATDGGGTPRPTAEEPDGTGNESPSAPDLPTGHPGRPAVGGPTGPTDGDTDEPLPRADRPGGDRPDTGLGPLVRALVHRLHALTDDDRHGDRGRHLGAHRGHGHGHGKGHAHRPAR
jgi:hypothetical protein